MNRSVVIIVLSCSMAATVAGKQMPVVPDGPVQLRPDTASIDTALTLRGVVVTANSPREVQMRSSQSLIQVDRNYLRSNFAGSLMQSLQQIPGVKAMSIGSGQSKPAIRGLGFNRMVVAEDGIKHEGQQWGDDHGLEIDQFDIDRIEVIKGPGALLYGSDAIGGVINLYSNYLPTKPLAGSISLFGRSNNASVGLSAKVEGRNGRFYYKANLTGIDYADYKVPTDSIQYYSYNIALKNRRLRNTAGKEQDASLTLGYVDSRLRSDLKLSNSYMKSGFFANAHGLEVRLSDIDYDASARDIDLPYQSVNHFKATHRTAWSTDRWTVESHLAYQNNSRKEYAEAVSHGYMPTPDGTLERSFDKHTFAGDVGAQFRITEKNTLRGGLATEYQHNRRSGWGFIIPDFETFMTGVYLFDKYEIGRDLIVNAGIRYDFARTHIHGYRDWFATPTPEGNIHKERSAEIDRRFNSLTWSAGFTYRTGQWLFKSNAGKSFRVPIPKELGADGINYHIFRYEQGNAALQPEESYQIDASISWDGPNLHVQFEPYLNHFPNYIYMNPTPDYVEGLQLYQYTQSKVLRYGFEFQTTYKFARRLEAQLRGEYLHAEQRSGPKKGFTLPFSPPASADIALKYTFGNDAARQGGYVELNAHAVTHQNEIVPPEKPTSGYFTLNITAGRTFAIGDRTLGVTLNADNLLNRKYYDHTNYYRLMNIPEPGRNVAILVALDF